MRFKAIKQLTEQEQMQEIYEYLRSAKNEIFNEDNTPISARILAWDLRTSEDHINELCVKILQDTLHYPNVEMISSVDRKFYRYIGNGD